MRGGGESGPFWLVASKRMFSTRASVTKDLERNNSGIKLVKIQVHRTYLARRSFHLI